MTESIKSAIPHRYPFLLIDRIIDFVPGESITALKNVTYNEPFFEGHFPENPIMPGVLIVEAMAQTCGVLIFRSLRNSPKNGLFYLAGVDVLAEDKLGRLGLTLNGCKDRDELVFSLAKVSDIPIMTTMGGGYTSDIKIILEAHCNTFRSASNLFY